MSALDKFISSNAWDTRYNLPTAIPHNNPAIYGAYALKIMRAAGLSPGFEIDLEDNWAEFFSACRIRPGLFNRWPDGGGGMNSHDELMGMAYISPSLAREVLEYLLETDGIYINKPDMAGPFSEAWNVNRMIFLEPFLRARAGLRVGLWNQVKFSAYVLHDLWGRRNAIGDVGGMLRMWIMLEAMEKFAITGPVIQLWRSRMKALGWGPKRCFTIYLADHPVYTETAPVDF